jgi:hypothetical protein
MIKNHGLEKAFSYGELLDNEGINRRFLVFDIHPVVGSILLELKLQGNLDFSV